MRKLLLTISLFVTAMLPTTALCQTAKPDSMMPKDTIQAAQTTPKDSVPLKLTDRMLKEVVVFGYRPPIKFKLDFSSVEYQLMNIRPSDLNFNILGFLGYLFKWIGKGQHRETKAERTQRLLREYDLTPPQLPTTKKPSK